MNGFEIGNSVNAKLSENEYLEQETKGQSNDLESVNDSARQNQVIGIKITDRNLRVVSSAVITVENRMHDAILTAIKNVIIPRVEKAVKWITGSTGHGTNGEVPDPIRRDFLENIRNTPVMSASSRLDLDNELHTNDGTLDDVDSEEGDFPALKHNYELREYAQHS